MEYGEPPGTIRQRHQEGGNRIGWEGGLDTQGLLYRGH